MSDTIRYQFVQNRDAYITARDCRCRVEMSAVHHREHSSRAYTVITGDSVTTAREVPQLSHHILDVCRTSPRTFDSCLYSNNWRLSDNCKGSTLTRSPHPRCLPYITANSWLYSNNWRLSDICMESVPTRSPHSRCLPYITANIRVVTGVLLKTAGEVLQPGHHILDVCRLSPQTFEL